MKHFLLFFISAFFTIGYGQTKEEEKQIKDINQRIELDRLLNSRNTHNVIDNKTLILKNKEVAIRVAEAILFEIYGKENIESQKPYRVNFIDNNYIIKGSLPKGYLGGVFLIIMDATNSKIIKISHGK